MRILFAAKYVPTGSRPIGGVQTWIATMRAVLEQMGHACLEWQPGMTLPAGRIDLGVIANACLTVRVARLCRQVVNVSHGIIPEEAPMIGVPQLFVSEGVRAHWGKGGELLRQPIDLDHWRPASGPERRGIIRFSYRRSQTLCSEAAWLLGQPYRQIHSAKPIEAQVALSRAALVYASGRAALEAMACGAPTVIYDHRSAYQGPLLDMNLRRQMENSYSGRGGSSPKLNELLDASRQAMRLPEGHWRSHVEQNHDARAIAARLLSVAGVAA